MPIDLDLDVLEEDGWPSLKFSAIPRSYISIIPTNLGGFEIFYDEERGKSEDFSERKKPHYTKGKK